MDNRFKKNQKKPPEMSKKLGSMNAYLMLDSRSLKDSGFSVEITDDELQEVMELFNDLEGKNEKDN